MARGNAIVHGLNIQEYLGGNKMTDKEKYEAVNEFLKKCEKFINECNDNCLSCVLDKTPIVCGANSFKISEKEFNQIMNYERKPKSQQMLEDLGFTKELKATFFNMVSITGSFSSIGVDGCGNISLSIHTYIWDNCNDAIDQFVKDVKGGLYD